MKRTQSLCHTLILSTKNWFCSPMQIMNGQSLVLLMVSKVRISCLGLVPILDLKKACHLGVRLYFYPITGLWRKIYMH